MLRRRPCLTGRTGPARRKRFGEASEQLDCSAWWVGFRVDSASSDYYDIEFLFAAIDGFRGGCEARIVVAYYILGVVDVVVVAGTRCSIQGNVSHVISEPSSL
jgi:hypothetical protein